ncbi:MAG: RrF2 family transcriptional regulator [Chitinophagaceae bacterium]
MFTKTTEYALRATIFLAQKSSVDNKLGIEAIAKAIDSPLPFTAKILQLLAKDHTLISSTRGPHGGFYMTEEAKQLPVMSILQATGEENVITSCVLGLKRCSDLKPCPMHWQYKDIKAQLVNLFENSTILALANDAENHHAFIKNR